MTFDEITLKKRSGIYLGTLVVDSDKKSYDIDAMKCNITLQAELMNLGFILEKKVFDTFILLYKTKNSVFCEYADTIINICKKVVGDDVSYEPMYPNFPTQVAEASELELFMNAIIHYWSNGTLLPAYQKMYRPKADENIKLRVIKSITDIDSVINDIFTEIVTSNESISAYDKSVLEFLFDNDFVTDFPEIPYKETLCMIAGMLLRRGFNIGYLMKSPTDVLRLITYLSNGDISLASNTKFKSLPRSYRKKIAAALNNCFNEEDIKRHANKWNKAFHMLHIGEYFPKDHGVMKTVKKLRDNQRLYSLMGDIKKHIIRNEIVGASSLLKKRPGEFARMLDELLRKTHDNTEAYAILYNFTEVVDKVSTRVLTQVYGHFKSRNAKEQRVIFPKGNVQKAQLLDAVNDEISSKTINELMDIIYEELKTRFSKLESLGNVYLDEALQDCPIPSQMRSTSDVLDIVGRGTRLPMGKDKDTLRLFVYWIGRDIDLSAICYDKNFNVIKQISYTNLREHGIRAYHSGDIVNGSNGACEFIDFDIPSCLNENVRYICMNVFVYSGPNFSEHEKVYAGWMERNEPNSNEIFEPSTVVNKLDIVSESRNAIPVIFDIVERKVIYVDLTTIERLGWGGNNVHSNIASINDVMNAMININNRMTLFDLFEIHAISRGTLVEIPEEADIIFALEGGIGPKDINIIHSEYIK